MVYRAIWGHLRDRYGTPRGPGVHSGWFTGLVQDEIPHPYGIHGVLEDKGYRMARLHDSATTRMPTLAEKEALSLTPGVPVIDLSFTSAFAPTARLTRPPGSSCAATCPHLPTTYLSSSTVNTPSLVIRERTPADLPAAAALVEVHRTDGYPVEGVADPTAWLTGNSQIRAWVAELDGDIVGHVAISEPDSADAAPELWRSHSGQPSIAVAVLGRPFVLPGARGHAAGRRLVDAAQLAASDRGVRPVLDVMTKDAAAIALYERLGWRRIGETSHDDGSGQVVPAVAYVSPA